MSSVWDGMAKQRAKAEELKGDITGFNKELDVLQDKISRIDDELKEIVQELEILCNTENTGGVESDLRQLTSRLTAVINQLY